MTTEERKEFEAHRAELIDNAMIGYGIEMHVTDDDKVRIIWGNLDQVVEFYQNYRSEIEEVI